MNKQVLGSKSAVHRPWSQRSPSGSSGSNPGNNSNNKNAQQELYSKLREYEGSRRLAYANKMDSISLYWKSYCDLLGAALKETTRAQRVVLGTAHAYLMYAEAMKSIFEDNFLDEKGNVTTNQKQKDKVAASRKNPFKSSNNGEAKNGDVATASAKDAVSVLKEIREAQGELASQFQESSKNMDEEIAAAIGSLLDTIQDSYEKIEQLGSSILLELEKTEQEVAQAWNAYLDSKSTTNGSINSPTKEVKPVDPWVVEMQYRVAVAYQNLAWEKGNEVLTNLLAKVKEEEITRRMNLREFLVAFAQRQQRLFLTLPGIQNRVLEDLVGKEMSREEMDTAVQAIIEERASKYKKSTGGAKNGAASGGQDDFADFHLESPLSSDLLSKAKVVLRKGVNMDWTVCLAVMTADSYLHMFDLDDPQITLSSPPEIAFRRLSPTLIEHSYENQMLGKMNFGRGWSDPLTPTESLILGKSKVKRVDETSFELTESLVTTGASKFMGKTSNRRIWFQTSTKEEADDWVQILTA
ncbi:hypothetical protein IV203_036728 [Nitzschia inconspicua]|uniref:PH domain-containing protein n=1 Tax=Nitzschia inconspicua TaxID=303405 RepID=A0A9K3LGE0_9STRA|nr:hypothetical protein IV203_036728 [Nitzschia inconspicua]